MPIRVSRRGNARVSPLTPLRRQNMFRLALAGLACGLIAAASPAELPPLPGAASGARAEGAFDGATARIEARLLVHPADLANGTEHVRVGVLLTPDPGWHIYWSNPGDSGFATRVSWQLERGEVGELAWPAPTAFEEADGFLRTHGYGHSVMLTAEASLRGGDADAGGERTRRSPDSRWLRAEVDVLTCEIGCIPGKLSLSRPLFGAGPELDAPAVERWFEHAAQQVPAAANALGLAVETLHAKPSADGWVAEIAVQSCLGSEGACRRFAAESGPMAFIPRLATAVTADVVSARPDGADPNRFILRLTGRGTDGVLPDRLEGVLALRDSGGDSGGDTGGDADRDARRGDAGGVEYLDVNVPFSVAALTPPSTAAGAVTASIGLLQALAFALLGGLLLNLMPCVLPVLAIKLCGVAELAQHDKRELRRHALAYTLGILVTLWVLATVVVGLREAGSMVGWGFQFQEPIFLVAVSTILVVFALNLFGVFEIQFDPGSLAEVGSQATGARRSFFEGLLAVVLATPCSAPFLGTAVGLAFAGSAALIYGVFSAIGLGLALPYLMVCWVPAWQRWVPRSGGWMLRVRAGLGFALLASVVWILWIAGRSIGTDAMIAILIFLLGVAFAVWIFGWVQSAQRPRWTRAFASGVALLAIAGPMWIRLEPASDAAVEHEGFGEPFARDALDAHLAAGRAAFVYFTADWCLTCKVNERLVLNDSEVREALLERDVAVLRADWTQRDDRIRDELQKLGKAAVPVYVVYDPREPNRPKVLPELLTRELLVEAVVTAASGAAPKTLAGRGL